jgi:hypothetical protein
MSDEDELYIKVVVVCNIVVETFLFDVCFGAKIFDSQDFTELISKDSIFSIVISECVVVGKVSNGETIKTKVIYLEKLRNFVVHNFFI